MKAQAALGQMVEHLRRALETPGDGDSAMRLFMNDAALAESILADAEEAEPVTEPDGDAQRDEAEGF